MRAYYLSVLHLASNATAHDIRVAYRRLSKLYHPDVSKAPDAKERFIEIKKAYDYLINPPAAPVVPTYPEEELTDREKWRIEARKRAKEKALAKKKYMQELLAKIVAYFKLMAAGILFFNMVLAIDYSLPRTAHDQKIVRVERARASSGRDGRQVYRYDDIHFEHFVMRFEKGAVPLKGVHSRSTVWATPILSMPMATTITVDGQVMQLKQLYNVYVFFGYLIPALLVLSALFFRLKNPLHQLNTAVVMCGLFLIQLVIFFIR